MSTNNRTFKYYRVANIQSEFCIEFEDLQEFYRFADGNQLRSLFLLNDTDGNISHFAASHKGGLLRQPCLGYRTLEDFQDARVKDFPDAQQYYQAIAGGYQHYNDYKIVSEAGIDDKGTYDAIKEKGFLKGYEDFCDSKKNNGEGLMHSYASSLALYKDAVENGFDCFADMLEAHKLGFDNRPLYLIAKSKGFDTAADYQAGKDMGLPLGVDYYLAKENGIGNLEEYQRFLNLDILKGSADFYDQRVLLTLLSKLPQGKKVSINKINELLSKAIAEEQLPDTQVLPQWFTIGMNNVSDIVRFLTDSKAVKQYGSYDTDGEYFETMQLQNRRVMVDGSNVAYNSNGAKDSKPRIANMILMVKELKKLGFEEIKVVIDAALKHRLVDPELEPELQALCKYTMAPAATTADTFIILAVKSMHCLVVSNDQFRDWKMKDPWVAQNIDFYRLSFLIDDGRVLLPDFKSPAVG
ncbi:MAG: hypothetical protein IT256_07045 [Chitinophagaceae bacterium]|nr:hypothetical protein [Chitinophagaceae bacterium]